MLAQHQAGYTAPTIPVMAARAIPAATPTQEKSAAISTAVGGYQASKWGTARPAATPTTAPAAASQSDSNSTNRTTHRAASRSRRMPNSRRRSNTLIAMVLSMPQAPSTAAISETSTAIVRTTLSCCSE